jgi:hypothetical protein
LGASHEFAALFLSGVQDQVHGSEECLMTEFSPMRKIGGCLPIEDHGLIGDGTAAALVGRDGAISWMCVHRFDFPPLFCGILDAASGGAFTVAPEGLTESRQFYESDNRSPGY